MVSSNHDCVQPPLLPPVTGSQHRPLTGSQPPRLSAPPLSQADSRVVKYLKHRQHTAAEQRPFDVTQGHRLSWNERQIHTCTQSYRIGYTCKGHCYEQDTQIVYLFLHSILKTNPSICKKQTNRYVQNKPIDMYKTNQ